MPVLGVWQIADGGPGSVAAVCLLPQGSIALPYRGNLETEYLANNPSETPLPSRRPTNSQMISRIPTDAIIDSEPMRSPTPTDFDRSAAATAAVTTGPDGRKHGRAWHIAPNRPY